MSTLAVNLSDAEIRRQAANVAVDTLRDPRYPGLFFRYTQGRGRGAWYLVVNRCWRRIAGYPDLKTTAVLAVLPQLRQRVVLKPNASVAVEQWSTVGDLLTWYNDRMGRDRSLSAKRKAGARSAIACHLQPRLADLPLRDVTAQTLDKLLLWPSQEQLSLSYVQQLYRLLVVVFRQAYKLGLIQANPMAGMRFADFTTARVLPKQARLRADHLQYLIPDLAAMFDVQPADAMLALLMLCHGTRVGETRQARWPDMVLAEGEWFIPAEHTKTRTEHRLPLTEQVQALLRRYRAAQLASGYDGISLFPNRRGQPLSDTQACAVFTRLAQGNWTSHDLRKVARTAWTDLGIDGHIGEMLLNHSLGKIASTYINTQATAQRRIALEKWHGWLDGRGFDMIHGLTGVRSEDCESPVQATDGGGGEAHHEIVNGEVSKA